MTIITRYTASTGWKLPQGTSTESTLCEVADKYIEKALKSSGCAETMNYYGIISLTDEDLNLVKKEMRKIESQLQKMGIVIYE